MKNEIECPLFDLMFSELKHHLKDEYVLEKDKKLFGKFYNIYKKRRIRWLNIPLPNKWIGAISYFSFVSIFHLALIKSEEQKFIQLLGDYAYKDRIEIFTNKSGSIS